MATTTTFKRDSPFLHRVWKNAVEGMGIKFSSGNGDKAGSGDHTPRAIKRRRIAEDTPEGNPLACISSFLSEPPANFERALRIEVLKIGRDDGPALLNGLLNGNALHGNSLNGNSLNGNGPIMKDCPLIRARCKVTIIRWKPKVEARVLHCDSQTCNIKVLRDVDDVCRTARVYLPQPFHVAADKIYIERDDDEGYNLADRYLVQAELESAGDSNWPPLNLLRGDENRRPSPSPPRQWVLSSQFIYKFVKGRMTSCVALRKGAGEVLGETNLKMDMDLRWTTFNVNGGVSGRPMGENTPRELKPPSLSGALEPLTNGHVNGRVETLLDGHAKDSVEIVMDDDEEVDGEANTPNRSLRIRGKQQNYNLKLLSDKARGKEKKERKKRKTGDGAADSGQVTWVLPVVGRVTLDENWSCLSCFATHPSFEMLKEHLVRSGVHPEVKYFFEQSLRGPWRITVTQHGQETPESMKSPALQEPLSPDEHESDSGEDISPQKPRGRSRSRLAHRRSVPAPPRETKQLIPDNKQPLFDRLSKVVLEPNSLVDEPQVDNTWLLQKHRDIIRDYSDVLPDEKEYISEWDAFTINEKASLGPHLQEVYLDFLREKSSWLAASQNRINEAMKHLAYLKARSALAEATLAKAFEILRQARLNGPYAEPESAKTATSPRTTYRQSESGCVVCGQPVSGPNALICSNIDCDKPLYHSNCIRNEAKIPVESRKWQCNNCRRNDGEA